MKRLAPLDNAAEKPSSRVGWKARFILRTPTASLRLVRYYSAGRSTMIGAAFLTSGPGTLATTATVETEGRDSLRMAARSSHLPKIIFPAVVCSTDVTEMSTVLPIIFNNLNLKRCDFLQTLQNVKASAAAVALQRIGGISHQL